MSKRAKTLIDLSFKQLNLEPPILNPAPAVIEPHDEPIPDPGNLPADVNPNDDRPDDDDVSAISYSSSEIGVMNSGFVADKKCLQWLEKNNLAKGKPTTSQSASSPMKSKPLASQSTPVKTNPVPRKIVDYSPSSTSTRRSSILNSPHKNLQRTPLKCSTMLQILAASIQERQANSSMKELNQMSGKENIPPAVPEQSGQKTVKVDELMSGKENIPPAVPEQSGQKTVKVDDPVTENELVADSCDSTVIPPVNEEINNNNPKADDSDSNKNQDCVLKPAKDVDFSPVVSEKVTPSSRSLLTGSTALITENEEINNRDEAENNISNNCVQETAKNLGLPEVPGKKLGDPSYSTSNVDGTLQINIAEILDKQDVHIASFKKPALKLGVGHANFSSKTVKSRNMPDPATPAATTLEVKVDAVSRGTEKLSPYQRMKLKNMEENEALLTQLLSNKPQLPTQVQNIKPSQVKLVKTPQPGSSTKSNPKAPSRPSKRTSLKRCSKDKARNILSHLQSNSSDSEGSEILAEPLSDSSVDSKESEFTPYSGDESSDEEAARPDPDDNQGNSLSPRGDDPQFNQDDIPTRESDPLDNQDGTPPETNPQNNQDDIPTPPEADPLNNQDDTPPETNPQNQEEAADPPNNQDGTPIVPPEVPAAAPKRKSKEIKAERKALRNTGQTYVGVKGKVVSARKFEPPHECRVRQCHLHITPVVGQMIFDEYWQMADHNKRVSYVAARIEREDITRKRLREEFSNREKEQSFKYFFDVNGKRIQVCRNTFLKTLGESDRFVRTVAANKAKSGTGIAKDDSRGHHPPRHSLRSSNTLDHVQNHIKSYPAYVSHYCRAQTNQLYLPSDLTVAKMHQMYLDDGHPQVSYSTYLKEFQKSGRKFHAPKSDGCDKCDKLVAAIKCANNEEEKANLERDKELHLRKAEKAYSLKREAKKAALQDDKKKKRVLIFDLQQCLPTPHLQCKRIYYSRQMYVYNFTIYDCVTDLTHCYMWTEVEGNRGSNELASCLLQHILEEIPVGVEELKLFSDCCSGQNRNHVMCMMLFVALQEHPTLKTVQHFFLVPGHTFMPEVDSKHSVIESYKKKHLERVNVPSEWYKAVENAGKTMKCPEGKFKVKHKSDFFNIAALAKNEFVKRSICTDKDAIGYLSTHIFSYDKKSLGVVSVKSSFNEEAPFRTLSFLRRGVRSDRLPRLLPNLKVLQEVVPISQKKKEDLIKLLPYLDEEHHAFYHSLPSAAGIPDTHPVITQMQTIDDDDPPSNPAGADEVQEET